MHYIKKDNFEPQAPVWENVILENSWPDALNLRSLSGIKRFIASIVGKRQSVVVPEQVLSQFDIPKYILQEFHNLPNGNYSNKLSRGYITGFDICMLGQVDHARKWLGHKLKDCESVVDVGTSGGKTAAFIAKAGVKKVWGIDPSPYLLKHASHTYPDINFIQGVAENLPFPDNSLQGIAACFVFHEIPPKYAKLAMNEFNRVLELGGKVAITEPSEQQLTPITWKDFFSLNGWLKLYFRSLANFVFEPFLDKWHQLDKKSFFENAGFQLLEEKIGMPINYFLLEKIKTIDK